MFPQAASAATLTRVLVFSRTAGFRHDSIPVGITAIRNLGSQNGFTVDATEDASAFTTQNLAQYQAVVWLSSTGDVLGAPRQSAFESYVSGGGGYVGVHSAADTEYDWAWYTGLGHTIESYSDSNFTRMLLGGNGNGADIAQRADTNATSQQWRVVDQGGGVVSLVNRQSGPAMDVFGASTANGARISQWTAGSGGNQRFRLQRV